MKLIYLTACLMFFTLTAISQTKPIKLSLFPKPENKNAYLFKVLKKQRPLATCQSSISGIQKLPQDNMPCLIADESLIAPIPTLRFDFQGKIIPNPYFNLSGR